MATISGTITENTGQPLSGVVVSAYDWVPDYPTVTSTVTGTDGHYRLVAPTSANELDVDGSNGAGGAHDDTGYLGVGR